MKRMKWLYGALGALLLNASHAAADPTGGKPADEGKSVREIVEAGSYRIEVQTALPRRGNNIQISSRYDLVVRNDSVFSRLPYFGRGYNIPYGGGEGLFFEAPIESYQLNEGKKGRLEISFRARSSEDVMDYRITLFDNGSASVGVTMQKRQGIDFIGQLAE